MTPNHSPAGTTDGTAGGTSGRTMTSGARPGGRSAKVRAAVHRAVEELVAESSPEALTIPAIAARAGVHPTTVYRRWDGVGDLLTAVARHRFAGDLVVPDTGSLRGDLELWMTDIAVDLTDPDSLALMRASIGAGGREGGCACVEDRQAQLGAILGHDVRRGGPERDVEAAADLLLGPLYYRAIFAESPAPTGWAAELVDGFLRRD